VKRRPTVRELADRARDMPYLIAIVAAAAIGVVLLATGTLIPVGAVLVLGAVAGIIAGIIRAAQS
jgi:hypothetical protein